MHNESARIVELSRVGVMRVHGEYRLLSTVSVPAGSYLFGIDGELTSSPSRYSVQVGVGRHVDLVGGHTLEENLDRFYWRFMNHSCEPNAIIRHRAVFALTSIRPWEEITFHYNTTEYEIAEPFDCHCGSSRCEGRIQGFRFLVRSERERLAPWLGAHLLPLLNEEHAGASLKLATAKAGPSVDG